MIDLEKDARDWEISDEGRDASQCLAERLAVYRPTRILCSDEPKAIGTARAVAERQRLDLEVVPELHEHDRRGVEWLERDAFHATMRRFFANPTAVIFGRESAETAHRRFRDALLSALKVRDAQTTVVVAHGTVISLFVAAATGVEPFDLWRRLSLPSYIVLSWPEMKLLEIVYSLSDA